MSRHSNHLLGQFENPPQVRIIEVHARFRHMRLANLAPVPAPHRPGQRASDILAQPHRLAHFANRHARAVVDHGGAQSRAVAAIAGVDILDHLLAPLMLEIDVDIGRFLAFFGNEPVEQ